MRMQGVLRRLLLDDDGQDVVEYALLTATIGLAGLATWPLIVNGIGVAYGDAVTDTQDIWEVPDPGAGG